MITATVSAPALILIIILHPHHPKASWDSYINASAEGHTYMMIRGIAERAIVVTFARDEVKEDC
jgi:hypothetical protein